MTLNELARKCHEDAKSLGWYDEGKTKSDVENLMMVVTELAEAVEEIRNEKPAFYYHPTDDREIKKPEGIAVEIADAIIRLLDMSAYKGYDIETVIKEKLAFNLTRGYRHGGKKV